MNTAFFDLDYTVYKKGSSPEFYKFIARKGWTDIKVMARHQQMREDFDAKKINYEETVEIAIQLLADVLAGKSEEEVKEWLDEFFIEVDLINKWVIPLFELLKKNGFGVYLVSASGSPVVNYSATMLKADGWFASDFENKNGKYTAKVLHFLHSDEKGKIVNGMRQKHNAKEVLAVGDSEGDAAMLAAADQAIVYQPWDEKFKQQAMKNGWKIVDQKSIFKSAEESLVND